MKAVMERPYMRENTFVLNRFLKRSMVLAGLMVASTVAWGQVSTDFTDPAQWSTTATYENSSSLDGEWEAEDSRIVVHPWVEYQANFLNTGTAPWVKSPVMDGVGSVTVSASTLYGYFPEDQPELLVQISDNGVDWVTVNTNTVNTASAASPSEYVSSINDYRGGLQVRIKRGATGSASQIFIHEISITQPDSSVLISDVALVPEDAAATSAVDMVSTVVPLVGASIVSVEGYLRVGDGNFVSHAMGTTDGSNFMTAAAIDLEGAAWDRLDYYVAVTFTGNQGPTQATSPGSAPAAFYTDIAKPTGSNATVSVSTPLSTALVLGDDDYWVGGIDDQAAGSSTFTIDIDGVPHGILNQVSSIPPIYGTVLTGTNVALETASPMDFLLTYDVETAYFVMQSGEYLTFNDWGAVEGVGFSASNQVSGWVISGGESSVASPADKPLDGRYISLREGQGISAYLQSPVYTAGVGTVAFWYRAPETGVDHALTVQTRSSGSTSWETATGGTFSEIRGDLFRFAEVSLNDKDVRQVRLVPGAGSWLDFDSVGVAGMGSSVTLTNAWSEGGSPALGATYDVAVDVLPANGATNLACYVNFRSDSNATYSRLLMSKTNSTADTYVGTIPGLPGGTVFYYFSCEFDGLGSGEELLPGDAPSTVYSYVTSSDLSSSRVQGFDTWLVEGDQPQVATNAEGWIVNLGYCQTAIWPGEPIGYLANHSDAFFQTPLVTEGIGTLYFDAWHWFDTSTDFSILTSTNGTQWRVEGTVTVDASPGPGVADAVQVEINQYGPVAVRIQRLTSNQFNNVYAFFDNIVISPAPADVSLTKGLLRPGYPAADQAATIDFTIASKSSYYPATVTSAEIHYEHELFEGVWNVEDLEHISGDTWRASLPQMMAGKVSYYLDVEFAGFFYEQDGNSENQSPAYLPDADEDTAGPNDYLSYQIRSYRSEFSEIDLSAGENSVEMELVGDYAWQGIVDVSSISNITWSYVGLNQFTNDAPDYSDVPVEWGDSGQFSLFPPMFGVAGVGESNITANIDYDGFLMFRFDVKTGNYAVRRAVYQDFNEWQASAVYFEESLGLYGVQSFTNAFEAYGPDLVGQFDSARDDFEGLTTPPGTFTGYGLVDINFWFNQAVRFIQERNGPGNSLLEENGQNNAARLEDNEYGLSGVWNTASAMPDGGGVEKVEFSYRLSIEDEPEHICYNKNQFSSQDYTVLAEMGAQAISPAEGSISLIFYYQDAYNFYEARLTQAHDGSDNEDDRADLTLWRCRNGVMEELTSHTDIDKVSLTAKQNRKLQVIVANGAGKTDIAIQLEEDNWDDTADDLTYSDVSADRLSSGSIGFRGSDTVVSVDKVTIDSTVYDFNDETLDESTWSSVGGRWVTQGNALRRPLTALPFEVRYGIAAEGSSTAPSEWLELAGGAGDLMASTMNYEDTSISLKSWQNLFVQVKAEPGPCRLVVDNLALPPWRGKAHFDSEGEGGTVFDSDWSMTDSWIYDTADHALTLDRTRADPEQPQFLRSPELTNGVGTVSFQFDVDSATSIFEIQRTIPGSSTIWETIHTETNAPTTGWSGFYLPVRSTDRAFVRVVHVSSNNAVLNLDNVEVTDYPEFSLRWESYNTLITTDPTDPASPGTDLSRLAFEPSKADEGARTCFLNSGASDRTEPGFVLTNSLPYVQSPEVSTGVGEVGFWYRLWEETPGDGGRIIVKAAPSEHAPEEEWVTKYVVDVTNTTYQYFYEAGYDVDNTIVRLYADTNASETARICVDNVLVSEPVRTSMDIVDVWVDPAIPLVGESVDVMARVGDFLMTPTNIALTAHYYQGTNYWGYDEWSSQPGVGHLAMEEVSENVYRTESAHILGYDTDDVVQYYATGEFSSIDDPETLIPAGNATEFTNPDWYHPVDLNAELSDGSVTSAYYYVFSCPTGTVWINELNVFDDIDVVYPTNQTGATYQYVELAGHAGNDIGGWSIDIFKAVGDIYQLPEVPLTYTVPSPFVLTNRVDGYGFFLFGGPSVRMPSGPALPGSDVEMNYLNSFTGTGIILKRSMGAYEQSVFVSFYEASSAELLALAENYPQYDFVYAGVDGAFEPTDGTGAVELRGTGSNVNDFVWWAPSAGDAGSFTAGTFNDPNQTLDPLTTTPALDLSVLSMIVSPGGGYVRIVTTAATGWTPTVETNGDLTSTSWVPVPPVDFTVTPLSGGTEFQIDLDLPSGAGPVFYKVGADSN